MSQVQKKSNTKQRQYEVMVDFMIKHPDLAKGHLNVPNAKNKSKELWDRLALDLNATGPPTHDCTKWKKVWADYKNHVKDKCRQNKSSISGTGGGPSKFCSLTHLEEKVVELLSIDKAVSGIDGTFRFGVNTKEDTPSTSISELVEDNIMENFLNIATDETTPYSFEKISTVTPPMENQRTQVQPKEGLLQKQVDNQIKYQENSIKVLTEVNQNVKECLTVLKSVNENLCNVNKYLKRSSDCMEKRYDLAKQKFEFKKRIELENNKQKMLQLQLKKEILEIKSLKYKRTE